MRLLPQHIPEVALVDRNRVLARRVLDVEVGIAALADAPVGFTAGVGGVVDVAAFGGDQTVEGLLEIFGF
jgi:hypothetical protein